MEAMPAGGRIVVATSNIRLDRAFDGYEIIPSGEYVCLSVTDNGIGIAESDLHKIFVTI
jgi:signal transduction histidine kinase